MNQADIFRYSQRADADKVADEIRAREVRINRDYLGIREAIQHGNRIADGWLRNKYEEIEDAVTARFGIHA